MRKTLLPILYLLIALSVNAQIDSLNVDQLPGGSEVVVATAMDTTKADSIIEYARKFIGKPYSYGGTSGNSFDCSGYTQYVFSGFEIKLPHSSSAQYAECHPIEIDDVRKGDLLFFTGRNASSKTIGHVSLVTEVQGDRIRMIHATTHGGVMEEWMNDSKYFKPRLLCAGRLKQMPVIRSTANDSEKAEKPVKKSRRKKRKK